MIYFILFYFLKLCFETTVHLLWKVNHFPLPAYFASKSSAFVGKWSEDRISLDRNFRSNVKTIHLVPWSKVICLGLVDRIFDLVKKRLLIKWPKLRSSGQTLDQVKFDLPTMTWFFGRTMTWEMTMTQRYIGPLLSSVQSSPFFCF